MFPYSQFPLLSTVLCQGPPKYWPHLSTWPQTLPPHLHASQPAHSDHSGLFQNNETMRQWGCLPPISLASKSCFSCLCYCCHIKMSLAWCPLACSFSSQTHAFHIPAFANHSLGYFHPQFPGLTHTYLSFKTQPKFHFLQKTSRLLHWLLTSIL